MLTLMELLASFQLVRYEVGRRFPDQFAPGVQYGNHSVGAYLPVVRFSWLWYAPGNARGPGGGTRRSHEEQVTDRNRRRDGRTGTTLVRMATRERQHKVY